MSIELMTNIFKIIGGVVAVLNFVGILFLFFANKFAFDKIMGNDLKHLDEKLDDVSKKQESIEKKVNNLSEDVAYIKGQCDAKSCFAPASVRRRRTATKKRTTKKVKK